MKRKEILALLLLTPACLLALPKGGEVKAGKAALALREGVLRVTAADKTIIDYQSFDIGSAERVEFVQPDSRSAVLNRVIGGNPSSIFGVLESNGRVFLLNPHGVIFGPESIVDVGTLVASTLDLANEDFLAGSYNFNVGAEGIEGSILNFGDLRAEPEGAIVLLASQVRNEGSITASLGKVVLASAEKATIDFSGDGLISFALEGDFIAPTQQSIKFDSRDAGCVVTQVVNRDGIIEGGRLIEEGGVVKLVATGSIAAGEIALGAARVHVEGQLVSEGDLTVEATQVVSFRDRSKEPLILRAGKEMLFSSPLIDILAWVDAATRIASGGSMRLISDNPISADARFFAGGDFSLLKPDGKPADFKSLFDPIISATGSVTFGEYHGVSLKVESTGNIICTGDITITGVDANACTPAGCMGDPDCTTLTTQKALILRAGETTLSSSCNPVDAGQSQSSGGATFSHEAGSGGTIFIQGEIDAAEQIYSGNVVLTADTTFVFPGSISFSNAVDGSFNMTLQGGNSVTFLGPVGSNTPIKDFFCKTFMPFEAESTFTAESIFIEIPSIHSIKFDERVDVLGPGGATLLSGGTIDIAEFTVDQGPLRIVSSDATSALNATGPIDVGGNIFIEATGGPIEFAAAALVNAGGSITVSGIDMSGLRMEAVEQIDLDCSGAITLAYDSWLKSDKGSVQVTAAAFDGMTAGRESLKVSAPKGSVEIETISNAGIGSGALLKSFTLTDALSTSLPAINTTSGISITANNAELKGPYLAATDCGSILFFAPLMITSPDPDFSIAAAGCEILFSERVEFSVPLSVEMTGSQGIVLMNAPFIGKAPGASLTVHAERIDQNALVTTNNGAVAYNSTVFLGHSIITGGAPITIDSDVIRDGDNEVVLDTKPSGSITINGTINGDRCPTKSLDLLAGTGEITLGGDVGNNVLLNKLKAEGETITLTGGLYEACSLCFNAGHYELSGDGTVILRSSEKGILFDGGTIDLSGNADLLVETQGGKFTFTSLIADDTQNVAILAGNANITLGTIDEVNALLVQAGQISLNGAINANELSLYAVRTICNKGDPQTITVDGNASFETRKGTIGSICSPIDIDVSALAFAGTPEGQAVFSGTTLDGTIHYFPNNFPCPLIFNGEVLTVCPRRKHKRVKIPARAFYVPGIYSQINGLGSDQYFLPEVVTDWYADWRREMLFWTSKVYGVPEEPARAIKPLKQQPNYRAL